MADYFMNRLITEGYRERLIYARLVCASHVMDLKDTLSDLHQKGCFDVNFFAENLTSYQFVIPQNLSDTSSLIIVAVSSPVTLVSFTWKDKTLSLPIPPTYIGYRRVTKDIEALASNILIPSGYHVIPAILPLKLLAVCSGLGEYGRNNICYIPGLGSYHQLVALFSDLPCPEDNWQSPKMMERCASCTICQRYCPTSAIDPDRFLLHAEKCITLHNEKPGDVPLPDWIPMAAHNALVGCMLCQEYCPENRNSQSTAYAEEEFTSVETEMLINYDPQNQLPSQLLEKIERIDLDYPLEILLRNLRAVFINQ